MEIWNNFYIEYKDIVKMNDSEYPDNYYLMIAEIKDKNTNYSIAHFNSTLYKKTLEFHIGTNEKMLKKLKLPTYEHKSDFSYREGKKYFNQKDKSTKNIPCLSLGVGNVRSICTDIIKHWQDSGYFIRTIGVEREIGNIRNKNILRYYNLNDK